jgi:hypothetical protein
VLLLADISDAESQDLAIGIKNLRARMKKERGPKISTRGIA